MDNLLPQFVDVFVAESARPVAFPKDGIEFIKNVIIERKRCSETVSVDKYDRKLNKCQTVFADVLPNTVPAPDSLIPTAEWQVIQESDFSRVRCRLSRIRNTKDVWKHPKNLPADTTGDPTSWMIFLETNPPLMTVLFSMKQKDLECALNVLVKYLEEIPPGKGIERKWGQWIYGLLAALKQPLTPGVHSTLREMARICSRIRSNLSSDNDNILEIVAPLNLFICLVARYFSQGDLAD